MYRKRDHECVDRWRLEPPSGFAQVKQALSSIFILPVFARAKKAGEEVPHTQILYRGSVYKMRE